MALLDRDRRRLNRAMPINCDIQLGDIIQEMQEKMEGGDGGVEIPDGSVTTDKLSKDVSDSIDGKIKKTGDTMTGALDIVVNSSGRKLTLAKTQSQSGNNTAPTTIDLNSTYLLVGGTEYNTNSYRLIGFGYHRHGEKSHSPAVLGYQEIDAGKDDMGDLILATRNSTTDIAPTIRMRVKHDGQVELEQADYVPSTDKAIPNKKYVDDQITAIPDPDWSDIQNKPTIPKATSELLASVDAIADPSAATSEDIANKINEILDALKG